MHQSPRTKGVACPGVGTLPEWKRSSPRPAADQDPRSDPRRVHCRRMRPEPLEPAPTVGSAILTTSVRCDCCSTVRNTRRCRSGGGLISCASVTRDRRLLSLNPKQVRVPAKAVEPVVRAASILDERSSPDIPCSTTTERNISCMHDRNTKPSDPSVIDRSLSSRTLSP